MCWAFKNSKYFYFGASLRVAKRKIFSWSTSEFIFSETNRTILKARHHLVAYKVLIDVVQLACLVVRDNAKAGNSAKCMNI